MDQLFYTVPPKNLSAPYGDIYKMRGDDDKMFVWVQTSKDVDKPEWKPIEELLIEVIKEHFDDPNLAKTLLYVRRFGDMDVLGGYFEFRGIPCPEE